MDSPPKKGPSTMTQQDLTEVTIEELYNLKFPFLLKQRSRQPLVEQLRSAIIAEANRRERALRVADRWERDERLINHYHQ